jgi:outer membrane protein OmpA-like peptidoglycan-associated protein
MGTTNSRGELFVPDIASFNNNLVSIKAGNIPLNYALKSIDLTISPPYRSGSCVIFPVKKLQPVTGILKTLVGGKVKPLEFAEMTIDTDAGKVVIPSGLGGEFYWEEGAGSSSPQNIPNGCSAITESITPAIKPGHYHGTAVYENKTYGFELSIPQSEAMTIDVGEIITEVSPEKGQEKPAEEKAVLEKKEEKSYASPEAPVNTQEPVQPTVPETPRKKGMETVGASTSGKKASPSPGISGEVSVIEVYFPFGTADLASENDQKAVIAVARFLRDNPGLLVVIEGHADQIGTQRYNMLLSKKRARKIAGLLENSGIPVEKIGGVVWFGKKHLKCFSLDENCRKFNRRVVIRFRTEPAHR